MPRSLHLQANAKVEELALIFVTLTKAPKFLDVTVGPVVLPLAVFARLGFCSGTSSIQKTNGLTFFMTPSSSLWWETSIFAFQGVKGNRTNLLVVSTCLEGIHYDYNYILPKLSPCGVKSIQT